MKRVRLLIALLIGISQATAADGTEEGIREYVDSLNGYTVVRSNQEPRNYYEILAEDSDEVASSFTLERIAGKVLLKDLNFTGISQDPRGFQSMVSIFGYLENGKYATSGEGSAFFLSDHAENESFYANYGFTLLTGIPDFLKGFADLDDTIYMREAKFSFQATDNAGWEGFIER